MINSFCGIKVMACPFLSETEIVQVKKHVKKGWMSFNYHNRINKKWLKRYGTEEILPMLITNDHLFTHPNNVKKIKVNMQSAHE